MRHSASMYWHMINLEISGGCAGHLIVKNVFEVIDSNKIFKEIKDVIINDNRYFLHSLYP